MENNTQLKKDLIQINKRIGKKDGLEPLEAILNHLSILSAYDRIDVTEALKIILKFADEPGNHMTNVRKLLTEIIENI